MAAKVAVATPAPCTPPPLAPAWKSQLQTPTSDSSGSSQWEDVRVSSPALPGGDGNGEAEPAAKPVGRKLAGSLDEIFAKKLREENEKRAHDIEVAAAAGGAHQPNVQST